MSDFQKYIYDMCKEEILNWDASEDIYAVGFLILNDDDNLRKPTLRLIYNTQTQVKLKTLKSKNAGNGKWEHPHSDLEATWNFPFWLWKIRAAICTDYISFDGDIIDHQGIFLRKEWIKSLGLSYEDWLEKDNFEDTLELGGQIGANFYELCISTAKSLHEVIQKRFGNDLPIIFFTREGTNPEAIEMTLGANDAHLLNGFTNYIKEYCRW